MPAVTAPAAPTRRWGWPLAIAGWTLLSLLISTQNYVAMSASERGGPSWLHWTLRELPVWYTWALLTPAVFFLSRRFPVVAERGGVRWRNALLHAAAAFVFVLAFVIIVNATRQLLFADARPAAGFWRGVDLTYRHYFGLFALVYGAIVLFYHAREYYRAYHARTRREAELEVQLAQAQLEALKMQLHPHFLFN